MTGVRDAVRRSEDRGYAVVSYKREDVDYARRIKDRLQQEGLDVWWDQELQCGAQWNRVIDEKFAGAGCIVVLWSGSAMQSKWVMHEASSAIVRDVYAPVRIELCAIDAPYNTQQATDIVGWDGISQHPGIDSLVSRVRELIPPPRPLPKRMLDWVIAKRSSLLLGLFSLLALVLLVWQTLAGLRLNKSMAEQLLAAREQARVLRMQARAMNEQAAAAASQVARIASLAQVQQAAAAAQADKLEQIGAVASRQVEAIRSVSREINYSSMQSMPLSSVRLRWMLRAPPWAAVPEVVARATCDELAASDDETKYWSRQVFARVCNSRQAHEALLPALGAIALGTENLATLYGSELQDLLTARPERYDGLAWHAVSYRGKAFELLLPLSSDSSVVMSVGDKSDVPAGRAEQSPNDSSNAVEEYIRAQTQHAFEVDVRARGSDLVLEWDYGSLDGALDGNNPRAYFPAEFKFAILHGSLPREQYAKHLQAAITDAGPLDRRAVRLWSQHSKLELVSNGMRDFAYDYEVTNLGDGSVAILSEPDAGPINDMSDNPDDWEPPKKRYRYTLFQATRR